jgi:indoleamine 2,3-dioxygenase
MLQGSYALYNYRLEDPKRGMEYDNLRLIRAFEKGLDPTSSEAGFVLVHVDMVQQSGELVSGATMALEACAQRDRAGLDNGLSHVVAAMQKVNKTMNSKLSSTPLRASFVQRANQQPTTRRDVEQKQAAGLL